MGCSSAETSILPPRLGDDVLLNQDVAELGLYRGQLGEVSCPPVDMLFAGESAGFQDTLWGFGMRYAMLSGHFAVRAWIEGDLDRYDQLWQRRFGGQLRSALVNRMVYMRLGDWGYKRLLRSLERSTDVRSWLNTQYGPSIWKRMATPLAKHLVRLRRPPESGHEGCDCTWCRCKHHQIGGEQAR